MLDHPTNGGVRDVECLPDPGIQRFCGFWSSPPPTVQPSISPLLLPSFENSWTISTGPVYFFQLLLQCRVPGVKHSRTTRDTRHLLRLLPVLRSPHPRARCLGYPHMQNPAPLVPGSRFEANTSCALSLCSLEVQLPPGSEVEHEYHPCGAIPRLWPHKPAHPPRARNLCDKQGVRVSIPVPTRLRRVFWPKFEIVGPSAV